MSIRLSVGNKNNTFKTNILPILSQNIYVNAKYDLLLQIKEKCIKAPLLVYLSIKMYHETINQIKVLSNTVNVVPNKRNMSTEDKEICLFKRTGYPHPSISNKRRLFRELFSSISAILTAHFHLGLFLPQGLFVYLPSFYFCLSPVIINFVSGRLFRKWCSVLNYLVGLIEFCHLIFIRWCIN